MKDVGTVVDIERELQYWQRVLPDSEFASISLAFESFVPTIKFGYDTYLLFHAQPLVELLPQLRVRYLEGVPKDDQLDWRWADQIIRHAWGRMRAV